MVLPLIPAALIAVGTVTGGSGLALGGKGALDIRRRLATSTRPGLATRSVERRVCRASLRPMTR